MAKLALTNLLNLQNENTAVSAINANNAATIAAMEKTLSRDGTSPDQMSSQLDMNSNRIINLPSAVSTSEPITLSQINAILASGQVPNGLISVGVPVSALMQPFVASTTKDSANAFLGNFDTRVTAAAATIPAGMNYLQTHGYTTLGDGGGAHYIKVVATSPGGFQSSDGSWWRIVEDIYDIRMFGAKIDGVTNDAQAIMDADAAAAVHGGSVRLPAIGFIAVNSVLTPSANAHWFGEGPEATTIYTLSATQTTFVLSNSNITLENFRVVAGTTRLSNAITFSVTGSGIKLRNIDNAFFGINVNLNSSGINLFDHVNTTAPVVDGVDFDISESFVTTISNCICSHNPAARGFAHYILRNVSGQLQLFNNNVFQAVHGIYVIPGNGQVVTLVKSVLCYFDSNSSEPLFISPTGTGTVTRLCFSDGWFAGSGSAVVSGNGTNVSQVSFVSNEFILSASVCLNCSSCKDITFINNNVVNFTGGGLSLSNVVGASVSANKFIGPTTTGIFLANVTSKACVHDNIFDGVSATIANTSTGSDNHIHDNTGV